MDNNIEKISNMEGVEINIKELGVVVENFLIESERYGVKCADLKSEILEVVLVWFGEKKNEIAENFKELHPQAYPPKQELLDRLRPVLPLERIPLDDGSEFRRTKIVDNWVSEIYEKILKDIFKK